MSKTMNTGVQAALLFLACLIIQLYPLPFHLADSVRDPGDPLLNTWIMAWVQDTVFSDPRRLFDAPIFHPLENTLSFSEHLLPQALLSLPVRMAFNNPVLAYNVVFFFSFLFAAYAMFRLVRRLTGNGAAGILCGMMFAFNGYHMDHVAHLQLLSSGLIPMTFLYLHDFFEDRRLGSAALAALAFTLQALASIYYGLFLLSVLLVALPLLLFMHRRDLSLTAGGQAPPLAAGSPASGDPRGNIPPVTAGDSRPAQKRKALPARLGLTFFISACVLVAAALPYLRLIKTYDFMRPLGPGADVIHYLAPPPSNVFLGKWLSPLGAPERHLFPGIAVILLAAFFLVRRRRAFLVVPRLLRKVFLFVGMGASAAFAVLLISGGFDVDLGILLLAVLIGGLLFLLASWSFSVFGKVRPDGESRHLFLYSILLFWAFFLSMGGRLSLLGRTPVDMPLPFEWFYTVVPGFKGIREPSRYAIFVVFCLTVMAGYGLKHLLERGKTPRIKFGIAAGLALFINLESLNIPQRIEYIPVRQEISPAARWLGEREGNFAVIELPFRNPIAMETMSMYFSIFHGKKLVNGFSGFIPPYAFHVRQVFAGFPSAASCDILDALGVKYVVVRPGLWNEETAERKLDRLEGDFAHRLRRVREFRYELHKPSMILPPDGREWIYEVMPDEKPKPAKEIRNLREIPASRWTISSNISGHLLPALKDGDLLTRWTTERGKTTGDYLLVEFHEDARLERVSLLPGPSANDYALDFLVEMSMDGRTWHVLDSGYSSLTFLLDQIRTPRNAVQHLDFNGETLRFLKITQIGDQAEFYWSVAEIRFYQSF